MRRLLPLLIAVALTGCNRAADDGVIDVAFIGQGDDIFASDLRLDMAGQAARAAQRQGLVRFNPAGEIVPGIAERWIVTDDGRSYIFRITEFDLPDGNRLTAQAVAASLKQTLARLDGTSLGLDLAKVEDIRAMTGRVIEIRLSSAMPGFLHLVAQPELGVTIDNAPSGPMTGLKQREDLLLTALAPELRGLPAQPEWDAEVRLVKLSSLPFEDAIGGFSRGQYDVVLGGRVDSLPLAATGPLSRGTVRLDPAIGLFGFDVVRPSGFLEGATNREALAMAIDRSAIAGQLGIGGWTPTTRIVPTNLPGATSVVAERWADQDIDQRRAVAASRVSRWRAANGAEPRVTVDLPPGPGSDILFQSLARDFAAIGVQLVRAGEDASADLVLRDRTARFAGARWFINQFHCSIAQRLCSDAADNFLELALGAGSPAEEAGFLGQAENALLEQNLFIPLGAPIRWSQLRANVDGFAENIWAVHPLFPLSRAPI